MNVTNNNQTARYIKHNAMEHDRRDISVPTHAASTLGMGCHSGSMRYVSDLRLSRPDWSRLTMTPPRTHIFRKPDDVRNPKSRKNASKTKLTIFYQISESILNISSKKIFIDNFTGLDARPERPDRNARHTDRA